MRGNNDRRRIHARVQVRFSAGQIQEFANGIFEPDAAAPELLAVRIGPPLRAFIRQHGQRCDAASKPVGDPVVVLIEPARQVLVGLRLNFHVDQYPFFASVE